jgi:hypothetical protein
LCYSIALWMILNFKEIKTNTLREVIPTPRFVRIY